MVKKGKYRLETFDDNDACILATTFYLDGDVFTELYTQTNPNFQTEDLLADQNHDKVKLHMKSVEDNVGSVKVLYSQIVALIMLITTSVTFIVTSLKYGVPTGAAATIGFGGIVFWLKKYVMKIVIWIIRIIVIPMIKG